MDIILSKFKFFFLKKNELLGQENTDFSGLFKGLKKASYTLDYDKKKFQKMDNNINPCGRWCIVFLSKFIQGYSFKEFQLWMDKENRRTGYTYDDILTLLT